MIIEILAVGLIMSGNLFLILAFKKSTDEPQRRSISNQPLFWGGLAFELAGICFLLIF